MRRLTAHGVRLMVLSAVSCQLLATAACHHAAAPPSVVFDPGSPPPPTEMVAVNTVTGTWRLRTEIQTGNRPAPRARRPAVSQIVLTSEAATTPGMGAPPGAQRNARVAMPGYSARAPRGQTGQAGTWWPIPGDSVVVQFSQGRRGQIQLRGKLDDGALQGEVWYLSIESGATFQMGTFSANKQR